MWLGSLGAPAHQALAEGAPSHGANNCSKDVTLDLQIILAAGHQCQARGEFQFPSQVSIIWLAAASLSQNGLLALLAAERPPGQG